jgi:SAM-dependent MidA family methyltransferase
LIKVLAVTQKESYLRFDESPIWQIHRDYFKQVGIKAWASGEIPYSGISNYHEAYKKARLLVSNFKNCLQDTEEIRILEVGAGYGEFAKNFLSAFKDICDHESLDYYSRLKYFLSDFSSKTLSELEASKRLKDYRDKIVFVEFDAMDKFLWKKVLPESSFNAVFANYLLDQLPARVFVKDNDKYFEKYIYIEDPEPYKNKKGFFASRRWIKKLKKKFEFRPIDLRKELSLEHYQILETCFRTDKASTVVYSYGALKAVKNFLSLLKSNGIIVCSDFNASTKPSYDNFEPCYYGNSLAQAVNFEFIYKYFSQTFSSKESKQLQHKLINQLGYQEVLIYEDPIKPLHTLILTRPDFPIGLELGEIYKSVYYTNWFLRALYRYVVELQLSFWLFLIVVLGYFFLYYLSH